MSVRYWAAALATVSSGSLMVVILSYHLSKEPVPATLAKVGDWTPVSLESLPDMETVAIAVAPLQPDEPPVFYSSTAPYLIRVDVPVTVSEPLVAMWLCEIASGETLDAILAEAGLAGTDHAKAALALGVEYDLR